MSIFHRYHSVHTIFNANPYFKEAILIVTTARWLQNFTTTSEVDGFIVRRHASFFQSFTQSRMRVACAGYVLAGRAVLHGQHHLSDHLPSVGSDDVATKNLVRFFVCQDLHKTLAVPSAASATVGAEGEGSRSVFYASLLQLFLRFADIGHLGVGVDDPRDAVVVHVAHATGQVLHTGNALLLSLVSQHGPRDGVPDGVDGGHGRLEVIVDLDAPGLVQLDAQLLQTQVLGKWPAPDGHQHHIELLLALLALLVLQLQGHAVALHLRPHHLRAHLELHLLLLQDRLELLGDLRVQRGDDAVQELDNGDLRPEPVPHRAHLQANHAPSNHSHSGGHLVDLQSACGVHYLPPSIVHWARGERGHLRAHGHHNVLRSEGLFSPLIEGHIYSVWAPNLAESLHVIHLVLFEEKLDTTGEAVHGFGFVCLHLAYINGNVFPTRDSMLFKSMLCFCVQVA
mmetsp:Transcript_3308/g.4848  ORF Transcript_3308/g.4848 Transcript_3308/m.4848 type:complete len:454 (+) Transcript_3308:142-1503(+)